MIYMVEIDFADDATRGEWNDWYVSHLATLLTVPGIETAQRFERTGSFGRRFLSVYTVTGLAVYESQAYRDVGGGGVASAKWKAHIRRRRNLFSGVEIVPEIAADDRLVMTDETRPIADIPSLLLTALAVVGLDGWPERRQIGVMSAASVAGSGVEQLADIAVYRPMTRRVLSDRYASQGR